MRYRISMVALLVFGSLGLTARAEEHFAPCVGLVADGSLFYLRPFQNNSPAFTATYRDTPGNTVIVSPDFAWDWNTGYAVSLGYVLESGHGMRGRYFSFAANADPYYISSSLSSNTVSPPSGLVLPTVTTPLIGGSSFASPGIFLLNSGLLPSLGSDQMNFSSSMDIQAVDLEFTYIRQRDYLEIVLGAGGRYQHIAQKYHGSLLNMPAADAMELQTLDSAQTFDGFGPTVSVQGRLMLPCGWLALYGAARGSLMVGVNRQQTDYRIQLADPNNLLGNLNGPSSFNLTSTAYMTSDQVLPVLELELGVDIPLGPAGLFMRAAVVSHTYFDINNNNTIGLFGGQLTIGYNY